MSQISLQEVKLPFQLHDYESFTPGLEPGMRGAEPGTMFSLADMAKMLRTAKDIGGLLQGNLQGMAVFHQIDARSEQGECVRDGVVHFAGQAAAFDVDGTLTANEEEATVALAEGDILALGLDKPIDGSPLTVNATFRSVQFGSIATRNDWQITEIEFPNTRIVIGSDGVETQKRYNRIISLTPLPAEETA